MAADLFGLEQKTPRTNSRPEAAALVEVLKALRAHPAVVWAERMNSGAAGWRLAAASGWRCAGAATAGHRLTRAEKKVQG